MTKLESAFNAFADAIADRVVEKLATQLPGKNGLVGTRAAAFRLGCSAATIRNKVASGELPAVRIDRHLRFKLRDLDALIEDSENR